MEAPLLNQKLATFAILVAALMLLSPLASAQSQTEKFDSYSGDENTRDDGAKCFDEIDGRDDLSCVVLYGHPFDLNNIMYINVQRPPSYLEDLSRGLTGAPGVEAVTGRGSNEFTLASSPGFVEYRGPDVDPGLHPERGLTADVELASDVDIFGYWYLSADFDEFSPLGIDKIPDNSPVEPGADPSYGIMPCLTVRMVLQEGRHFGNGEILAEGRTTKTIVTGMHLEGTGNPGIPDHPCADGHTAEVDINDVIEFEVNLGKASGAISAAQGFIVFVHWWNHAPGSPNNPDKVYMHQWNLRSGSEYMPRIVVPLANPIWFEGPVRPQFFDGKLFFRGTINSPWGSYDVDTGNIKVEVFDANGAPVAMNNLEEPILRYSVDHDGHFKPVNAAFPWDFRADNVPPGEYTVRMTAMNWQWTGEASREARIIIHEDISKSQAIDSDGQVTTGDPTQLGDAEESPTTIVPLLTVGILGLLGLFRIRRRA
jgi:hypothetical protein